ECTAYLSSFKLFGSIVSMPFDHLLPMPGKPPPAPPPIWSWSFCSSSMDGIPPPPPGMPGIPGICGMPPPRLVLRGFLRFPFLPLRPFGFFFVAERRSEEHTSELQSRFELVCRLLLEKKKYECQYGSERDSLIAADKTTEE